MSVTVSHYSEDGSAELIPMLSFEQTCAFMEQKYSTVWAWYSKRADTGFPEPIMGGGTKKNPFFFLKEEIENWWLIWCYTRRKRYGVK